MRSLDILARLPVVGPTMAGAAEVVSSEDKAETWSGGGVLDDGGTGDVLALPMLTAPAFLLVPPPAEAGLATDGAGLDASNEAMSLWRSSSLGVCCADGFPIIPSPPTLPPVEIDNPAEEDPTKCSMARWTSYEATSSAVLACLAVKPIPSTSRSLSVHSDADIAVTPAA